MRHRVFTFIFEILKGKKVGLITNPTGVSRDLQSCIDLIFNAPGVSLTALYGPEHGVRGEFTAGETIGSSTDPSTGLPVYSLYGSTRKPTADMLKGIEVLVYDIQDIGSRSYTYISTLGLAMEAAAENNIPFLVLDRPNPLGGERMEGPLVQEGFTSFVSQYPVPYIHGMTVGELALFLNGEGLLKDGEKCNLELIKMSGWKRDMCFEETGLPWVPSSPHIPQAVTCYYYPATGIVGELYVRQGMRYGFGEKRIHQGLYGGFHSGLMDKKDPRFQAKSTALSFILRINLFTSSLLPCFFQVRGHAPETHPPSSPYGISFHALHVSSGSHAHRRNPFQGSAEPV